MALLKRTQVFPLADYPNGTQVTPALTIEDTATSTYFEIARCTSATPTIWSSNTMKISIIQELSFDGGNSWQLVAGFSAVGGIFVEKNGVESPLNAQITQLPPGVGRKIRAQITLENGPIRTQGFFETRN